MKKQEKKSDLGRRPCPRRGPEQHEQHKQHKTHTHTHTEGMVIPTTITATTLYEKVGDDERYVQADESFVVKFDFNTGAVYQVNVYLEKHTDTQIKLRIICLKQPLTLSIERESVIILNTLNTILELSTAAAWRVNMNDNVYILSSSGSGSGSGDSIGVKATNAIRSQIHKKTNAYVCKCK